MYIRILIFICILYRMSSRGVGGGLGDITRILNPRRSHALTCLVPQTGPARAQWLPIIFRIYTWRSISTLVHAACVHPFVQHERKHGYRETLNQEDRLRRRRERERLHCTAEAVEHKEQKLRHRCEWYGARRVKIACQ